MTGVCNLIRPRAPSGAGRSVAFPASAGSFPFARMFAILHAATSTAKGDTMGCGVSAYPYLRAGGG